MPRVTMNENKFETLLDPTEIEEDKKQLDQDLETMGPLYYSGEKKF